jgi:uncharacterized protein YfaS (alpha-2-macroglobulin family)
MFSLRMLATLAAAAVVAQPPSLLQVLSSAPGNDASLTSTVQVIFDRPVAGSLDRTVDAATILRISPAVPGKAEWRDQVTLRFVPTAPFHPGQRYTVTVLNTFQAMDGSALESAFNFSFTVSGPKLLTGLPVGESENPRFLAADATFEVVYSAELADQARKGLAYLDLSATCSLPGVIRLTVTGQRAISEKDPWQYQQAGGWDRDRAADRYRRVVSLKPERPLPLGCSGHLVAPSVIDAEGTSPYSRWAFQTYGPFKLLSATCASHDPCPTGGIRLTFSTPVRGSEVMRRITVVPSVPYSVADTTNVSDTWYLETQLQPHIAYAVIADTGIRDDFGQRLTGNNASGFRTTGFAPLVEYEYGRMTVERAGFATLAVKHVNVDTLTVEIAPVPDALVPGVLQYSRWNSDDSSLAQVLKKVVTRKVAVPGARDRVRIYGVKLPTSDLSLLQVVRVTSPALSDEWRQRQPLAVVQVTDLAVHARIGPTSGIVWVTGVSDGQPRAGATVTLYNRSGKARASARAGLDGVARFPAFAADTGDSDYGFEGYVVARLGNDRGLTPINSYDPDLSPWRFNVRSGYGAERLPVAAAVFTERGIYRPGEPLFAKAIVRRGNLGALQVPLRSDSLRWTFHDRDGGVIKEVTVAPSAYGTSDQKLTLPSGLPLGSYAVSIKQRKGHDWIELASTSYRIAEYRPPEFLVDVSADSGARFPGDSTTARIEARYLFGAPMVRAAMTWVARQTTLDFWDLDIPETDGFYFGENGWWWEDYNGSSGMTQVIGQGADTLDAGGRAEVRVGLVAPPKGRPARATIQASITDVNRQAVASATSFLVHPSSFYIGARPVGKSYFWTAGAAASVQVIAARPNGDRVSGVKVTGTVVRREWHRVHRTRAGYSEVYGEWVSDTVAQCQVTTARQPVDCRFTPPSGGTYILTFEAKDDQSRPASTSIYRWATGPGYVPWNDDSQFKMDVIPDKSRYAVGDTATVLFASPFADAEAWITVEREGLIRQQRLRLTSGSTTIKFPVTEQWAPNVFVSIVVTRGRSARPGPLDDPGRPTIRVGYAELRVTPEVKRLAVTVSPKAAEYRPGDTARVDLTVKDRLGRGHKSEVTLWAVDEGVLALTGYRTPDPIDLLYAPRGLGLRLSSNVTVVAPQVPAGEKGGRAPGGGGGLGESDILRSQFRTTAFFLGSVVTDSLGRATASAKLPDNLTTFRVMAVAVTAGDRYGNGQSPMLVTRPLVARPALPRFLREGDRMSAGVVVNQRAGGTPQVKVEAEVTGAKLDGAASKTTRLEAGRGREVRFEFSQPGEGPLGNADSSTFRFGVTGAGDADAVQKRLAVRPAFRPRAWTVSGVLNDTATAELIIPDGLDPVRSRLQVTVGSSPLSVIKGLSYELRVYPYYCTEQASSAAQPIIALYRAQQGLKGVTLLPGNPRRDIELAVSLLSRRQRQDGGIGYWKSDDWTTPWLSALAGNTLLDARAAGIAVDDSVLARLAEYLRNTLKNDVAIQAPVIGWYSEAKATLSDKVAAADYLSRYGKAEVAAENDLLRSAPQLAWEDRARLAEVLARRKAFQAARGLLQPTWDSVKVEGRRAVVPEAAWRWQHYFYSRVRPVSRLLTATLAVDSGHALIGPLVETLVDQGRAGVLEPWNTQDYASAVSGLVAFDRRIRAGTPRSFTVRSGGKVLLTRSGTPAPVAPAAPGKPAAKPAPAIGDSAIALTGLITSLGNDKEGVKLSLAAEGSGSAIYYYITVNEVPTKRPVNPEEKGIRIERWYEKYDEAKPISTVAAGELVRVRLRITVPTDRTFIVVDDALPAGLEAVDLSLRTASLAPGPGTGEQTSYLSPQEVEGEGEEGSLSEGRWYYGSWDSGWWSPFEHKEIRDDRVVYSATVLWKGIYTMSYIARATTPGTFVRPPAHAEEMYNPAVYGRSDGGTFVVSEKYSR